MNPETAWPGPVSLNTSWVLVSLPRRRRRLR